MSDAKPIALDYARGRLQWRPWLKRAVLLAWVALTAYFIYDKWALWGRLQYAMLRSQQACLQFAQAPNVTLYDNDPGRARALLQGGNYREPEIDWFSDDNSPRMLAASTVPQGRWDQFMDRIYDLNWWNERKTPPSHGQGGFFGGLFGGDKGLGPRDEFVVFLHERRSPSGETRLVSARAYLYHNGSIRFGADVWSVAGWFGRPRELTSATGPDMTTAAPAIGVPPGDGQSLRLLTPEVDPSDASRFTLPFEIAGKHAGVVEGRLLADDHVEFQVVREEN
jgi:hypothetical protein